MNPDRPVSVSAARLAVAVVFFVNGAGFASWVSRIPAVRNAMDLSDGQLGMALFALAAGSLASFPLAARGCVILGARSLALATSLAYCFLLPHATLVGVFSSLVLCLFGLGAINGAMDVAINALAAEVEKRAGRPVMSSLHGMWSAGGLAGAAFGGLMARLEISPALHLSSIALTLAIAVLLARRWLPEPDAGEQRAATPPRFARPDPAMAGLACIIFCAFLIEGAMADWSAVFIHNTLGASTAVAALGYAFYSLTMMLMRFTGDTLVARLGPVMPLRIVNMVAAVALALALLSGEIAVTMGAFAMVGLAVATVAPLVFGTAARRDRRGPGHGIAAMASAGCAGFLLGPLCIGWIAEMTNLRIALALLVVLSSLIALLAAHLGEDRGVHPPTPLSGERQQRSA